MKTVGTKLDNSEYEIFEFCCNEKGLTKSEQLRTLIKEFVDDKSITHSSANFEHSNMIIEDVEPVKPTVELIFD